MRLFSHNNCLLIVDVHYARHRSANTLITMRSHNWPRMFFYSGSAFVKSTARPPLWRKQLQLYTGHAPICRWGSYGALVSRPCVITPSPSSFLRSPNAPARQCCLFHIKYMIICLMAFVVLPCCAAQGNNNSEKFW